jgi:hypothetical protein
MSLDRGCDTDAMNEYRQVRIDSRQFAVVAEHFIGDIERIVFEMRTTSTPRSRARSVTSARAALPPPEDGLMNSTGRFGTSAGVQPWSDNCRGGQLTVGVRVSES